MLQLLTSIASDIDPYSYTYTTTTTTTHSGSFPTGLLIGLLAVSLLVAVLLIASLWKIFVKAGRPGWAAIVPVYNTWVLFEIVGYPGWFALLAFIPFVNLFVTIILIISYFKLAKLFGKGDGFAVCTILFPFVCLPILAYGSAQFQNLNPPANGPGPSGYGPQPPQQFAQSASNPVTSTQPQVANPVPQQGPGQQPPAGPFAG